MLAEKSLCMVSVSPFYFAFSQGHQGGNARWKVHGRFAPLFQSLSCPNPIFNKFIIPPDSRFVEIPEHTKTPEHTNNHYCIKRESIIGVQWGQGNPNPRVHCSSGKRGFAEFPTGTVDLRVGISRFHCTPIMDSISFFLSLYTATRPRGHSRQVGAASE